VPTPKAVLTEQDLLKKRRSSSFKEIVGQQPDQAVEHPSLWFLGTVMVMV
jgi:hypothetical protein